MGKKVLVISTSLRKNSNSDILANQFINGAKETGCEVEKISLINKQIGFCKGCLVCQNKQPCVIKDDANEIVQKINDADIIAFATPIYFYEMSGQMKTLLDRTNPLFVKDYQFRDIYLLATCAEDDVSAVDTTIQGLKGWIECFEKATLKGVIKGIGVTQTGEIANHEKVMNEAYLLGKGIAD